MGYDASDTSPLEAEVELREVILIAVISMTLNPYCAICGAAAAEWRYLDDSTPFRTMEEAMPAFEKLALEV